MLAETPNVPACVCPLCGQPNSCAMEQRQGDAAPVPCWCITVVLTPELLQRIPEAARGRACVCRACATSVEAQSAVLPILVFPTAP